MAATSLLGNIYTQKFKKQNKKQTKKNQKTKVLVSRVFTLNEQMP